MVNIFLELFYEISVELERDFTLTLRIINEFENRIGKFIPESK
jgi:hypothetical protein